MSIKVQMDAVDLKKQIDLLQHYPEVLEKHFRPMLIKDVAILYSKIKKTAGSTKHISKRAQATLRKTVRGRGLKLEGKVGWWGKGTFWQVNILEHGAVAHEMNTYAPGLSRYVKKHPGISAAGFMAAGYSTMTPIINADLKAAGDAVQTEMAIK